MEEQEHDDAFDPSVLEEWMRQGRTLTPQQMNILYQEKVAEGEARMRSLMNQQDFHRASSVGNGYAEGEVNVPARKTASEDSVARYLWDRIWRAKTGTIAPTDILSPNPSDPYSVLAQKGMTNVMQTTANNPGLKIFMGKIKGTRPKLVLPHPARPRLPNAAQLAQSIETPIGVKKGSISINPANRGKFTATQKATGKSVEELKHSSNPLTRKRAVFAQMAKRHFKPLGE